MLRTLCLSGGGFRATLFHLGAISALRDFNLLKDIKEIYSVSGGSILAAHVVLHWDKYNHRNNDQFGEIAGKLIAFIRSDLRGRLVRRWLVGGSLKRFRRVNQLIRDYDNLYGHAILEKLQGKGRPNISILATSMITGDVCAFSQRGIRPNCFKPNAVTLGAPHIPLSYAVAASSAFPPLFPPVELERSFLRLTGSELLAGEVLTDGGVIDNLGIATIPKERHAQLFVSDASAGFEAKANRNYGFIIHRTIRSTDILMSRIAALEKEKLSDNVLRAEISTTVEPGGDVPDHILLSDALQHSVKFVRTDLDRFSDLEIDTIYQHGYEVAAATLLPAIKREKSRTDLPILDRAELIMGRSSWTPVRWRPSTGRRISDDESDRMRELMIRMKSMDRNEDAPLSKQDELDEMELAAYSKRRLWDFSDPLCYISAILVVLAVGLFVAIRNLQ